MKENEYTHKPLLTKREREVFELLVQDKTTKEIAGELFISEKTVRNHISNAMQKLGVKGRSQAIIESFVWESLNFKINRYPVMGYRLNTFLRKILQSGHIVKGLFL